MTTTLILGFADWNDQIMARAAVIGDEPVAAADVAEVGGGPGGEQLGPARGVFSLAEMSVISIFWWPSSATMASSRMRSRTTARERRENSRSARRLRVTREAEHEIVRDT
jgi:hypothetical protein